MSSPDHGRAGDGVPGEPTVSTAPATTGTAAPDVAPAHRWWSSIPRHLGRARTSTVVLVVLFLSIGALYLNVRPPAPGTPASREETVEQTEPAETEPTGTEPTGTEPTGTEPAETTTEPVPTTGPSGPTTRSSTPTTTGSPSPGTSATPTAPGATEPVPTGGSAGPGDEASPESPTG
ncbi:hypothetical protein ABC795_17050 [Blastococcus sp. HT6-30]|uniref:hypothetical protein n=1 Tax=Blastococcus sp. HT6-30 TaxID=3144843 RepID=UPI00321A0AB7